MFIKHKKKNKKTCICLRLLSGFTHLLHTICSKPLFWPLHVCLETAWSWNQLKHWRCFHPHPHGQSGEAAPPQRSVKDPPKKQKQDVFNDSKIGYFGSSIADNQLAIWWVLCVTLKIYWSNSVKCNLLIFRVWTDVIRPSLELGLGLVNKRLIDEYLLIVYGFTKNEVDISHSVCGLSLCIMSLFGLHSPTVDILVTWYRVINDTTPDIANFSGKRKAVEQ